MKNLKIKSFFAFLACFLTLNATLADEWHLQQLNYARAPQLPINNTYYSPEQPGKLNIEFRISTDALTVELSEIEGKIIKIQEFSNLVTDTVDNVVFEIPQLPEGAYQLRFTDGAQLEDYEYFRIRGKQTKGVSFDENGWTIVDGKVIFPIGQTHVPISEDTYRASSEAGINTICHLYDFGVSPQYTEFCKNMLKKYHLNSFKWSNLPFELFHANKDMLELIDQTLSDLPGFMGFLDDEGVISGRPCIPTRQSAAALFKRFPDYILWENQGPYIYESTDSDKNKYLPYIRRYAQPFNVVGIDVYPIQVLPIQRVPECTRMSVRTGWGRKPVWMILQNYDRGRLPNFEEHRFMAYSAIVNGATGIFYHAEQGKGHGPCDELGNEYWNMFSTFTRQLAEVGKILAGSVPVDIPEAQEPFHAKAWQNDGVTIFIATNESDSKTLTYSLPLDGDFYEVGTGKKIKDKTVALKPCDAIAWATKPIKINKQNFVPNPECAKLWAHEHYYVPGNWIVPQVHTEHDVIRAEFTLDDAKPGARMAFAADGFWRLKINGKEVNNGTIFYMAYDISVEKFLQKGINTIEIEFNTVQKQKSGAIWYITAPDKTVLAQSDASAVAAPAGSNEFKPVIVQGPHTQFPNWGYKGAAFIVHEGDNKNSHHEP